MNSFLYQKDNMKGKNIKKETKKPKKSVLSAKAKLAIYRGKL